MENNLYSNRTKNSFNRWIVISSAMILCLFASNVKAQNVEVTGTIAGTTMVSYPTFKAACDAINLGTHTGVITVNVVASTTEAAVVAAPSVILNASGVGGAVYSAINMQPVGGAWTISGAATLGFPLIDLIGVDNLTINGNIAGTKSLTFSNTTVSATSNTCTFRLTADATSNTFTNCIILNSATAAQGTLTGGIIIGSAAVSTGCDNNTISNNDFGPAGANLPTKHITMTGSTNTDPGTGNSGNVITGNNFFDYFGATTSSAAIDINSGTPNLTITNNKFYQTGTRTQSTGTNHSAIRISNSGGITYTITGNTIGYASNAASGTYTLVGVASTVFLPINLSTTAACTTSVQNNTITAINMSGVLSGTTSSALFRGIYTGAGVHNIGNVTGNTIGSLSATGAISITSSSTSAMDIYGIYNFSSQATNISNNNIGGITGTNSSTGAVVIGGIRINTATGVASVVNSNTIGGTVANSILNAAAAATTGSRVLGIQFDLSNASVTGNTIRNLTAPGGTGTTTSASAAGIVFVSTSSNNTVTSNTIHTLSNTNTTTATTLTGIYYTSSTGTNVIERNFIHSFSAASTAGVMHGILAAGGTATYRNNMIRLGIDGAGASVAASVQINGINETGGTNSIFHNTVYIGGGSVVSGAINSFAFTSTVTTTTRSFRDNIFQNARSNTSGTGKHYVIRVGGTTTSPTGLTLNNNVYQSTGTGAVFGLYNGSDVVSFAAWKATPLVAGNGPGLDAASFNSDPQLLTPGGTSATVDLHINPSISTVVEGNGADVGVTDDFDGATRSGLTPVDIGADAGNFTGNDLSAPSISYTQIASTCGAVDASLTATITDGTGVKIGGGLGPRIYYKVGVAGTYTSAAGSLTSGTALSGTWSFTITQASTGGAANDTIFYYVIAQDSGAGSVNVGSNPSGVIATDVNTVSTPPSTASNFYKYLPSLGGTYSVGAAGTYTTITAAVAAYNNACLTSAVIFNLIDAAYAGETFPITINNNTFASATNTLTIKTTQASTTLTGSISSAIFILNGADYVTIDGSTSATSNTVCPNVAASRDLTITNTNTGTASAVIWLQTAASGTGTAATNNAIKNCVLRGNAATGQTLFGVGSGSATIGTSSLGTGNINNTYINNDIGKCLYGVYSQGASAANKNSGTVINQNLMNNASPNNIGLCGIFVGFDNGVSVSRNTISEVTNSGDMAAINVGMGTSLSTTTTGGNEVTNASITKNTIGSYIGSSNNSTAGIALGAATSGTSLIANNMIYGVNNSETSPDYAAGIVLGGGTGSTTQVYYNTVLMTGTQPIASGTQTSACLAVTNATGITLDNRNNIYVNNQVGGSGSTTRFACVALAYSSTLGNYTGLTSDHNNYYVAGAGPGSYQVGVTSGIAGTSRITLADWTTQTGRDGAGSAPNAAQTTLQVNPVFTGPTDLHLVFNDPANITINDGASTVSVTDDIDCTTRATDIGADEFTPPACTAASASTISASVGIICGSGASVLSTTASNTGTGIKFKWQSSQTGTSGSWADAGGNDSSSTYNTGTLTASDTVFYRLVVTCTAANVGDTSNTVDVKIHPIPTASISGSPLTYCANTPTTFNAVTNGTSPSYQWSLNGSAIGGATASSFSPIYSGNYTVTVTALSCSATSSAVAVKVNEAVTINTFTASPSPACDGSPISLVDSASGGTDSATFSVSFNSGTISVAVPDNVLTGATTTLAVSGGTGNIAAATSTVQVTFSMDRPTGWLPDCDVYLVGPSNCGALELTTDNGTSGATASAFTNTVLKTPSAFASITTGTQPFTGNFSPEGNLTTAPALLSGTGGGNYSIPTTALAGCPVNGTWTLFVGDDASGDVGTITNFQLAITGLSATQNFTTSYTGPGSIGAPSYSQANNSVATAAATGAALGSNTYTVTVTGANGCTSTQSVTVNVNTTPTGTISPDTSVCPGSTATLHFTFTGTGPWTGTLDNGDPFTSLTSTHDTSFIASTTHTYTIATLNDANCAAQASGINTTSATITVHPTPAAISISGSTDLCEGAELNLHATLGFSSYAWTSPQSISPSDRDSLYAASVVVADGGSYTVTATDGNGCTTSSSTTVTVTPNDAVSVTLDVNPNDSVCAGTNMTFTANGTNGGGSPLYEFFLNNLSQGAPSAVNTFSYNTPAMDDTVYVVLTSSTTCATGNPATSNKIRIYINSAVAASVTVTSSDANDTICAGDCVTFTATPTGGGATPSYQWQLNHANVGMDQPTYMNCSLTNLDTVSVIMTSSFACATGSPATSSDLVTVVNPLPAAPIITPGGPTTFCYPADVVQLCSDQASGNTWSPGGETTQCITVFTTGNYTVTYTDANGCQSTSAPTPVTVNNVSVVINPGATICGGDSVLLTANAIPSAGTTYLWSPGGQTTQTIYATSPGTYTVYATSTDGCLDTATTNIIVNGSPTVSIAADCTTLLKGNSSTLTATATAGSGTISTYQWVLNGTTNVGTNSATYVTSIAGSYTCKVTNSNGCTTTSNIVVLENTSALSGSYTIGGAAACNNWTSFVNAFFDASTRGVSANVTVSIAAGYTETVAAGGLTLDECAIAAIRKTGSTQTLTYVKSGAGANPKITTTGTAGALDAVIKLVGMDYVTFDGINVADAGTTVEWGYALVKCDANNGSNSNRVINSTITLSKTNTSSVGIYSGNHTGTSTTTLVYAGAATQAAVDSSRNGRNVFYADSIRTVYNCVNMNGHASSTGGITLNDTLNEIGRIGQLANVMTDFGGGAIAVNVIRAADSRGLKTNNNVINGGAGSTLTVTGILETAGSWQEIKNNTITLASSATTSAMIGISAAFSGGDASNPNIVDISGNIIRDIAYVTATSGTFTGITCGTAANPGTIVRIRNNQVTNNSLGTAAGTGTFAAITCSMGNAAGSTVNLDTNAVTGNNKSITGTFTGITQTGSCNILTMNGNTIVNNAMVGGGVACTFTCMSATGTTGAAGTAYVVNGNTIRNNRVTAMTGTSIATLRGFTNAGSPINETVTNNTIRNLFVGGASTGIQVINGINHNTTATGNVRNVSGNTVDSLYHSLAAGSATLTGIISGIGGTVSISKNRIFDLFAGGSSATASAIVGTSGNTTTISNNYIGDLRVTGATAGNALRGIEVTSSTSTQTYNIYYNTIRLAQATNAAGFGSSGISVTTTPVVDMRNNLVINTSTTSGAGGTAPYTVAYRRSSSTLTTFASTSNNNLYYAGTPGTNNLIYYGTTAVSDTARTIQSYKAFTGLAPRESNSVTENVVAGANGFQSVTTTAAASVYLHISAGATTLLESGGTPVAGISTDYDNDPRHATLPDIGADEFTGTTPAPLINSVAASPATGQCTAVSHTVTANVTVGSSTLTSVTLNYAYNGTAQTPIAMTGGTTGAGTTSNWTGVIPAATPTTALVTWSVAVSDGTYSSSTNGTSYRDNYLALLPLVASVSPNPVCSGATVNLSSNSASTGFTEPFETSSFPLTTFALTGTGATASATQNTTYFSQGASSVRLNQTAVSAFATLSTTFNIDARFFSAGTLTFSHQCVMEGPGTSFDYGFVEYSVDGGSNWITFPSSSYVGSGTLLGTGTTTQFSTRSYPDWILAYTSDASLPSNSLWKTETINLPAAVFTSSQFRIRFRYTTDSSTNYFGWLIDNVSLTGTSVFTSYSWSSDPSGFTASGATATANPTVSTTYILTAFDANGCSTSDSTLLDTVNALPARLDTIVGTSYQCGLDTPGVLVDTTDILAGNSTRWYHRVAGVLTAIPSLTGRVSVNFTISQTDTFYVTQYGGLTGCESLYDTLIANVIQPDPILATVNGLTLTRDSICPLEDVTLTYTQTGSTNVYTQNIWSASPLSGSGFTGTLSGVSVGPVQPTAPGTYYYTITATDFVSGCVVTSTDTVVVNNVPNINTLFLTPATPVCAGSPVILTAGTPAGTTLFPLLTSNFNSGAGGWTVTSATTGGTTPANAVWTLRPSGFVSGSAIVSNDASQFYLSDADACGSGVSVNEILTSPAFSTVGMTAASLQFYTFFQALFTAGVDTSSVEVSTNGTTWTILADYAAATEGATAAFALKTISLNAYIGQPSVQVRFKYRAGWDWRWAIDNVTVIGTGPSYGPGSYTWTWSNPPANGYSASGSVVTIYPQVDSIWTVTALDPVTGCSNSLTLAVDVNPNPAPPTAHAGSHCGNQVPVAYFDRSQAGDNFRWYTNGTGSTFLAGETDSVLHSNSFAIDTCFYVVEINPTTGCQSFPRVQICETVISPDTILAAVSPDTLCPSGPLATVTLVATDISNPQNNAFTYNWTSIPSGLTATGDNTTGTVPNVNGWVYIVATASGQGCVTSDTDSVFIRTAPLAAATTIMPDSVCPGDSAVIASTTNAGNIAPIYTENFNSGAGGWTVVSATTGGTTPTNANWTLRPNGYVSTLTYNSNDNTQFYLSDADAAGSGVSVKEDLISPSFSTVGLVGCTLQFHTFFQALFTSGVDTTAVDVSTDGGSTWTQVADYAAATIGSSTGFVLTTVDISAYVNQSSVRVRYRYRAGWDWRWAIDNVTVLGQYPAASRAYAWVPSPYGATAGMPVDTTTANITVHPTATTVYTVYISDPSTGCVSSAFDTVKVRPTPSQPTVIGDPSTQCGTGVPALSATPSVGNTIRWYTNGTGGIPVAIGNTPPSISSPTTFYVAQYDGHCEGPRDTAFADVTSADSIYITGDTVVCFGDIIDLMVNQVVVNNTYTYTWSSSVGGALQTTTGTNVQANPADTGVYAYYVVGVDGNCNAYDTVLVHVAGYPIITGVTATPTDICLGDSVHLEGASIIAAAGTTTIGTQTTTGIAGSPFRGGAGTTVGNKVQYLFTAAELTSAGLTTGNITSLAVNVTSAVASYSIPNFTIRMGTTGVSTLASPFQPDPASIVFGPLTVPSPSVTGFITLPITPFFWNGTSNVLIQVCNDPITPIATSLNVALDAAGTGKMLYQNDAAACAGTTAINLTNRAVVRFGGQVGTNVTSYYTWTWSPGGATGSSVYVHPTVDGVYQVIASNGGGCNDTAYTDTIHVHPIPAAPTANHGAHCGTGNVTASVTGSGGTFNWYLSATGNDSIANQHADTLANYPTSATDTFWVAEVSAYGCIGARVELHEVVTYGDTIAASVSEDTLCQYTPITLIAYNTSLTPTSAYTYSWTSSPPAGPITSISVNGDTAITSPTDSGTIVYTVFATDGVCNATATVSIRSNPAPGIDSTVANPDTIVCVGNPVDLSVYVRGITGSTTPPSYCVVANQGSSCVTSVEIVGTTLNTTPPGCVTPFFHANPYSGSTTATLTAGQNYTINLVTGGASIISVWIDYDRDGLYEASEWVQPWTNASSGSAVLSVPANASLGATGMRVRSRLNGNQNGAADGCLTPMGSGSTEDYTVTLAAQNPTTFGYVWTPGNLLGSTVTVTPMSPGTYTYYVQVIDSSSFCSSFDSVSVVVLSVLPQPTIDAAPDTICSGGIANITVTNPVAYAGYQWQSSTDGLTWSDISLATATSYSTGSLSTSTYYRIFGSCGATVADTSDSVLITVLTPRMRHSLPTVTRCGLGSVHLVAYGIGTFQWFATSSSTTLLHTGSTFDTTVTGSTTFWVIANLGVCVDPNGRQPLTVTVSPAPLVTITPSSDTLCSNENAVTLTAASANDPNYTYNWTSIPAGFTASNTASISDAPTSTITYVVTATDNTSGNTYSGCAFQTTQTVVVYTSPDAAIVTPSDTTICEGSCVTLNVTNVPPDPGGTYTYPITNLGAAAPLSPTGPVTTLVTGGVATPAPTGSLDDGVWNSLSLPFTFPYFGTNFTQFSVSTNGFISLDALNTDNGCCSGDVLPNTATPNAVIAPAWEDHLLSATGTIDYFSSGSAFVVRWTAVPRFGASGAPMDVQVVLYPSGVIEFHVTSITCGATDVTTMGIEDPSGTLFSAVTGRNGVAGWTATNEAWRFTPIPPGPPVNYTWSSNPSGFTSTDTSVVVCPTVSTVYTVIVRNNISGCPDTTTATVNVTPFSPLSISVSPNDTVCEGETVTLDAGTYDNYSWSDGSGIVGTSQTLNVTESGTYTVAVQSGLCVDTDSVVIVVLPFPAGSIIATKTVLCTPDTAILTVNPSYDNYLWSPNGETTQSILAGTGGTYSVIISNNNGCSDTLYQMITSSTGIGKPVITDFTTSQPVDTIHLCYDGINPASVILLADTTGSGDQLPVIWNDPNGTQDVFVVLTADVNNPNTSYGYGTFTVIFTVSNANGCSNSDTVILVVEPCNGGISLEVDLFIQGYYLGGGFMQPTMFNQGVSIANGYPADATVDQCDTITVQLYADPYNCGDSPVDEAKTILNVDGTSDPAVFSVAQAGVPYWIVVKHRGCIPTWSSTTVTSASSYSYDFRSSISSAFGDNLFTLSVDVPGDPYFALYNADLDQDKYVLNTDFAPYDADNFAQVGPAYVNTDMNGDGYVLNTDFPIFDLNNFNQNGYLDPSFCP